MSYRVLTGPAIPFVHALPSGLGLVAEPEAPAPGSWKELVFRLSEPFAQAGAQRLAYGKTDPSGSPFSPPRGSAFGYDSMSPFGGLSPTMLLLGGVALVAMMMLRK